MRTLEKLQEENKRIVNSLDSFRNGLGFVGKLKLEIWKIHYMWAVIITALVYPFAYTLELWVLHVNKRVESYIISKHADKYDPRGEIP